MTYLVFGMKIMAIPAMKRMTRRAKKTPPQAVKSILVWNAKRVRARVTAQVIPTAMMTDSVSYLEAMQPRTTPSHAVKIPRKMKLCGVFLLTSAQQARVRMQTIVTAQLA